MFKRWIRFGLVTGAIVVNLFSSSISAQASNSRSGLSLGEFDLTWLYAMQTGGSSYDAQLGWRPGLMFGDRIGIRAYLGGTALRDKAAVIFPVLEYTGMVDLWVTDSIGIEAGAGFQNWIGNGGDLFLIRGNVVIQLSGKILFFDRLILGYGNLKVPGKK